MEVRFTIDVSLAEVLRKAGKEIFLAWTGEDRGKPPINSRPLLPVLAGKQKKISEGSWHLMFYSFLLIAQCKYLTKGREMPGRGFPLGCEVARAL